MPLYSRRPQNATAQAMGSQQNHCPHNFTAALPKVILKVGFSQINLENTKFHTLLFYLYLICFDHEISQPDGLQKFPKTSGLDAILLGN